MLKRMTGGAPMKTLLASSALVFGIVATLTAISIALAADNKVVKAPQPDVKATGAQRDAPYGGLTREEHIAIPYHPCIEPKGWVNGKLVCDNR
jgi:hypothetical protein